MRDFWSLEHSQLCRYIQNLEARGGQLAYEVYAITLPNDVQKVADILLRLHEDIQVIVFRFNGIDNNSKDLNVMRGKVLDALLCLTATNEKGLQNNLL